MHEYERMSKTDLYKLLHGQCNVERLERVQKRSMKRRHYEDQDDDPAVRLGVCGCAHCCVWTDWCLPVNVCTERCNNLMYTHTHTQYDTTSHSARSDAGAEDDATQRESASKRGRVKSKAKKRTVRRPRGPMDPIMLTEVRGSRTKPHSLTPILEHV